MAVKDDLTVVDMFRQVPVRTGLFTLGPIVLAIAQLFNSVQFGLPSEYASGFAAVMIVFSALVTQYHLASFRLSELQRELDGEE